MRFDRGWLYGLINLLDLLFGGQARDSARAQRDAKDALAALKMPTPKLVMPPAKGTAAPPAAAADPKAQPSRKTPKSGWQV
jgi:hypothetical protein